MPSHFEQYPVSQHTIDFIIKFSEENIANIQIYIGEFNSLISSYNFGPASGTDRNIYYKEHPLNNHYEGVEDPREWMFDVQGYYPSFFAFWKKCKTELFPNKPTSKK